MNFKTTGDINLDIGHYSESLSDIRQRWEQLVGRIQTEPSQPSTVLQVCLDEMGQAL